MKLIKYLFRLLRGHSVESIVADISTKVDQLHEVAYRKTREADRHADAAFKRSRLAEEARAVQARARSIAAKFEELIA